MLSPERRDVGRGDTRRRGRGTGAPGVPAEAGPVLCGGGAVDRAGSRQAGQRERSPFGFTNPGHLHLPCVRWRTHFHAFLDKTTSDDCYARSTNHRPPGRGARGGRLRQRLPTGGVDVPLTGRSGEGRQRPPSVSERCLSVSPACLECAMSVPSLFELQTLGGLDLRSRDGAELRGLLAQPKRLALLIYLAVAQPRGFHRRDTLLALFWPELDQGRARAALRKAVLVVRQGLGPGALVGRGDEELGLAGGVVSCDAIGFERAVGER